MSGQTVTVSTARGPVAISAEAAHDYYATQERPLRTLPASWWDADVAAGMADWIDRFVPPDEQLAFVYGRHLAK